MSDPLQPIYSSWFHLHHTLSVLMNSAEQNSYNSQRYIVQQAREEYDHEFRRIETRGQPVAPEDWWGGKKLWELEFTTLLGKFKRLVGEAIEVATHCPRLPLMNSCNPEEFVAGSTAHNEVVLVFIRIANEVESTWERLFQYRMSAVWTSPLAGTTPSVSLTAQPTTTVPTPNPNPAIPTDSTPSPNLSTPLGQPLLDSPHGLAHMSSSGGPQVDEKTRSQKTDPVPDPPKPSASVLSSADLAIALGLASSRNAVDNALRRHAKKYPECRDEVKAPRKWETRILYRVDHVWLFLLSQLPRWRRSSATRD
jgi:hypothetical protein